MASLGQELKRERELRGISLSEISDSTKISLRYLRALENDELDILPGQFFTKGIIRAYAKCLGLEEESVLNKYYEDILLREQILDKEKRRKERDSGETSRKTTRMLPYGLVLIILIFLIVSVFVLTPKRPSSLEETFIPSSSLPPGLPHSPQAFQEETFLDDKIHLDIFFKEKTWIQVYADGELKLDGVRSPGEKIEVRASEELLIHLGNAGGITYSLNNKAGKPLGSSGAVVKNIKITPDNLQEFYGQEELEEITKT